MIEEYIRKIGFGEEAARLYGVLVKSGPLTLLEASRATGIERTALYRQIDSLTERGLIEEVLEHKSRRIRAADPSKIKLIVENEKTRVEELVGAYASFENIIATIPQKKTTQVRYYRGVGGIKQILWNETKAHGNIVAYTYRNLEEAVGIPYSRTWVAEIEKQKIVSRDLRSDTFLASTNSPGYEHIHIDKNVWRYLPASVMRLAHNMDIYNDVMAIYYWEDGDIFGVEIQNQMIADTQRSIFETLWKLAEKQELPEEFGHLRK